MLRKLTKIVATIPNGSNADFIRQLYDAGMDAVRLNTAHTSLDQALDVLTVVRSVSEKIPVMLDTKGPEIRTTGIEAPLYVTEGDRVFVGQAEDAEGCPSFLTTYEALAEDVPVHSSLLIDDGSLLLTVEECRNNGLFCRVGNSGRIPNRKSVNIPGVHIHLPSLSEKDRDYVHFAVENDIDFIAHSFVRNRDDVVAIQSILDTYKSPVKIIAKIENQEGVDHIEEILDIVYGVMVARGDMGVEIPIDQVPIIQKKLIAACIARGKPVITATQMLHSMIENPRPTRAEASDVATAVFDGTDAVMLSGETACGKYPLEAVKAMAQMVRSAEKERLFSHDQPDRLTFDPVSNFLAQSATVGAVRMKARMILCDTSLGYSARLLASHRCPVAVQACTASARVQRELALSYGVYAFCTNPGTPVEDMVRSELQALLENGQLAIDDTVLFLVSSPGKTHQGANMLEFNTARSRLFPGKLRS